MNNSFTPSDPQAEKDGLTVLASSKSADPAKKLEIFTTYHKGPSGLEIVRRWFSALPGDVALLSPGETVTQSAVFWTRVNAPAARSAVTCLADARRGDGYQSGAQWQPGAILAARQPTSKNGQNFADWRQAQNRVWQIVAKGALCCNDDFTCMPGVWAEADDGTLEDQARAIKRIAARAGCPPFAVVFSGSKSLHVFWRFNAPLDRSDPDQARLWQAAEKALLFALGGDLSVADPRREMRMPGFCHPASERIQPVLAFNPDATIDPRAFLDAVRGSLAARCGAPFTAAFLDCEKANSLRSALGRDLLKPIQKAIDRFDGMQDGQAEGQTVSADDVDRARAWLAQCQAVIKPVAADLVAMGAIDRLTSLQKAGKRILKALTGRGPGEVAVMPGQTVRRQALPGGARIGVVELTPSQAAAISDSHHNTCPACGHNALSAKSDRYSWLYCYACGARFRLPSAPAAITPAPVLASPVTGLPSPSSASTIPPAPAPSPEGDSNAAPVTLLPSASPANDDPLAGCQVITARGEMTAFGWHLSPLNPWQAVNVVQTPCGSGKSEAVAQWIGDALADRPGLRVLWIVARRSLAKEATERLKSLNFQCYLTTGRNGDQYVRHNLTAEDTARFVCCIDSLYRLADHPAPDVLVLDEDTEILSKIAYNGRDEMRKAFGQAGGKGRNLYHSLVLVYSWLATAAGQARTVFCCDAIHNAPQIEMISALADSRPAVWLMPGDVLPLTGKTLTRFDYGALCSLVASFVAKGEPFALYCLTKGFCQAIAYFVRRLGALLGRDDVARVICHTADNHLAEPAGSDKDGPWRESFAVVYNGSISSGISFKGSHFAHVVAVVADYGLTGDERGELVQAGCRSLVQALQRCRGAKHFWICSQTPGQDGLAISGGVDNYADQVLACMAARQGDLTADGDAFLLDNPRQFARIYGLARAGIDQDKVNAVTAAETYLQALGVRLSPVTIPRCQAFDGLDFAKIGAKLSAKDVALALSGQADGDDGRRQVDALIAESAPALVEFLHSIAPEVCQDYASRKRDWLAKQGFESEPPCNPAYVAAIALACKDNGRRKLKRQALASLAYDANILSPLPVKTPYDVAKYGRLVLSAVAPDFVSQTDSVLSSVVTCTVSAPCQDNGSGCRSAVTVTASALGQVCPDLPGATVTTEGETEGDGEGQRGDVVTCLAGPDCRAGDDTARGRRCNSPAENGVWLSGGQVWLSGGQVFSPWQPVSADVDALNKARAVWGQRPITGSGLARHVAEWTGIYCPGVVEMVQRVTGRGKRQRFWRLNWSVWADLIKVCLPACNGVMGFDVAPVSADDVTLRPADPRAAVTLAKLHAALPALVAALGPDFGQAAPSPVTVSADDVARALEPIPPLEPLRPLDPIRPLEPLTFARAYGLQAEGETVTEGEGADVVTLGQDGSECRTGDHLPGRACGNAGGLWVLILQSGQYVDKWTAATEALQGFLLSIDRIGNVCRPAVDFKKHLERSRQVAPQSPQTSILRGQVNAPNLQDFARSGSQRTAAFL